MRPVWCDDRRATPDVVRARVQAPERESPAPEGKPGPVGESRLRAAVAVFGGLLLAAPLLGTPVDGREV